MRVAITRPVRRLYVLNADATTTRGSYETYAMSIARHERVIDVAARWIDAHDATRVTW